MQQWKEQEAARTARAAQAVQEYKDTQQAQDELNSLERAMQTMGVSFEDVSADAVDRVLKILSTGGYTMEGERTAQEADTRLQILASMVAMREEDKLQTWNAGNNIKQIMDQGDGRVVIIVQLREVVKCSKADIVTNLLPILPEISAGDLKGCLLQT